MTNEARRRNATRKEAFVVSLRIETIEWRLNDAPTRVPSIDHRSKLFLTRIMRETAADGGKKRGRRWKERHPSRHSAWNFQEFK